MQSSRRDLLLMSFAAAPVVLLRFQDPSQDGARGRRRPEVPDDSSNDANLPKPPNNSKTLLEERQRNIRKDVDKLYSLAMQLKAEVDKTDSTSVLSLAMLKKAEEIEKLAKQIKDRARG